MTRKHSLRLYAFDVDTFVPAVVIVTAEYEEEARADAMTAAINVFGRIARIKGTARGIAQLPVDATPVRRCVSFGAQWAWIMRKEAQP